MAWILFTRSLRLHRRSLLLWSLGLTFLTVSSLATWPTVRDQAQGFQQAIDQLPDAMKAFIGDLSDITTGPGFIRGRMFSLMLPLLLAIYAIGRGSDAIAGDEERGTLDVVLAYPVPRWQVFLHRSLAMLAGAAILLLPQAILIQVGDVLLDLDLDEGRLWLTVGLVWLHTATIGLLALGVGAAFGRRAWALGSATTVAVGGFILDGLANLSPTLEGLHYASTFHYYDGGMSLTGPVYAVGVLVLLGLALAAAALGWARFVRRDVGVA